MRKAVFPNGFPVPERFGLNTVKGNVDIAFEGIRYK